MEARALKLAAVSGVAALAIAAGALGAASPAKADAGNCSAGLYTATTAWGWCAVVAGPHGTNAYRLVANCWFYPQRITYGTAGHVIFASCPGWSHVTWEQAQPFYG